MAYKTHIPCELFPASHRVWRKSAQTTFSRTRSTFERPSLAVCLLFTLFHLKRLLATHLLIGKTYGFLSFQETRLLGIFTVAPVQETCREFHKALKRIIRRFLCHLNIISVYTTMYSREETKAIAPINAQESFQEYSKWLFSETSNDNNDIRWSHDEQQLTVTPKKVNKEFWALEVSTTTSFLMKEFYFACCKRLLNSFVLRNNMKRSENLCSNLLARRNLMNNNAGSWLDAANRTKVKNKLVWKKAWSNILLISQSIISGGDLWMTSQVKFS